jgi:hypothetical protein
VTGNPRQMALLGPPAITVHNDGNMVGQTLKVDLRKQIVFCRFGSHT